MVIKSTLEPKRYYKRGRIVEIHKGIDGCVRYATYELANGKREKRHVKDLILLPFEKYPDNFQVDNNIVDNNKSSSKGQSQMSKKQCSLKPDKIINN